MADCNDDMVGGYRAAELVGRQVWFTGPGIDVHALVVGAHGLDLSDGFAGSVDLLLGAPFFGSVCTFPLAHCAIAQVYGSPGLVEGC